MAIVYTGTRNLIPDSQIPSGYTRPTVSANTKEHTANVVLTILKATVDESARNTTLTAIFENATIGIDKQILDLVTADFDATKTVVAFGECTALTINQKGTLGTDVWLTDTAASYTATVSYFTSVT